MKYKILVRYYHQEGINDGKYFEVVDEHFNLISRHKSHKLAEKKIKELMKINNIGELELFLSKNGFLAIGKKGKNNIWSKGKLNFIIKEIKLRGLKNE